MLNLSRTFVALVFVISANAYALPPWSSPAEAVAIQGYDPVAYFTKNDAVRGSSKYVHDWSGMTWFFSSAENREMFAAEPEKYAPQFGGFCTPSIAGGKNSRGGGDAWVIYNGKLYLSYDKSVRESFQRDIAGVVSKAEGWWPTVKARLEKQ
jgi:YHS domain-containing protein